MLISSRYKNDGKAMQRLTLGQRDARMVLLQKLSDGRFQTRPRDCLLCGASDFSIVAEKDRYGIPMRTGVCRKCGMVQTVDQMRPSDYQEFYSGIYRKLYEEHDSPAARFRAQEDRGDRLVPLAQRHLPSLGGLRMVEVGCGAGGIVSRFAAAGCDSEGFDFDDRYLGYGRQRGGHLTQGNAFELVPPWSCDIVVLSHVLEHMSEPQSALKGLRALLKPKGILVIAVPGLRNINVRHYQFDFLKYLQNAHLFHFDGESLKFLANRAGLDCAYLDEDVHAICLRAPEEKAGATMRPGKHDDVVAYLGKLEAKRKKSGARLLIRSVANSLRESGGQTARAVLGPRAVALLKGMLRAAQRELEHFTFTR